MRCLLWRFCALVAAGVFSAAGPSHVSAQETRDVNGRIIGSAQWHEIHVGSSDFDVLEPVENFLIRKKNLPDRTQELWFHRENDPNAPLFQAQYERLHSSSFSRQNFDRDFESVFNGLFRKVDVTLDDALSVEDLGRDFRIAWAAGTAESFCVVGFKMFGPTFSGNPEATGNKSFLIFVCQQNGQDKAFLKNALLSFLAMMRADGRSIVPVSANSKPFSYYEAKLFDAEPTQPLE